MTSHGWAPGAHLEDGEQQSIVHPSSVGWARSEAFLCEPANHVVLPTAAAEHDVALARDVDLHAFRLVRAGGEEAACKVVRERLLEVGW